MDYTRYHPQIKCEGTETMSKTKRKKIRKRKSRGKEIPQVVMRRAGRYKGNLFQMSRVPQTPATPHLGSVQTLGLHGEENAPPWVKPPSGWYLVGAA